MVVITISGPHGAGKSTYAKAIANALNIRYISSGQFFRTLAEQSGLDLSAFSKLCEKNKTIDEKIDQMSIEEAKKGNAILEGQLVSWMAKNYSDLNIYVTASNETRIKRISMRDGLDFKKADKLTLIRSKSEYNRFKRLYKIDINNMDIYDLILNTDHLSKEKSIAILIAACKEFTKN